MIASMTGFGRGLFKIDDIEVNAEVRTVNNRFLDIILKIPRCLTTYEQHIRELVGQYIRRGRVNVWIGLSGERAESWKLRLNKNLVSAYLQIADTLKKEFTVPGELGLAEVMTLPDLIETEESDEADEASWQCTQEALKMALESLVAMRLREGEELKRDFEQRIENLARQSSSKNCVPGSLRFCRTNKSMRAASNWSWPCWPIGWTSPKSAFVFIAITSCSLKCWTPSSPRDES